LNWQNFFFPKRCGFKSKEREFPPILPTEGWPFASPVVAEQTIEIYAFMSAADVSKAKNGIPVSLKSVIRKAKAVK
jgi:hypothetical protein